MTEGGRLGLQSVVGDRSGHAAQGEVVSPLRYSQTVTQPRYTNVYLQSNALYGSGETDGLGGSGGGGGITRCSMDFSCASQKDSRSSVSC